MTTRLSIGLWPPSANTIWRNLKGQTVLSKQARQFYRNAPWMIKLQAKAKVYEIGQALEVSLVLRPPDKRPYDIDNRAKAVLDALTKSGVIADDRQVRKLTLEKADPIQGGQVLVEIAEYASEKEPSIGQRARAENA